mmetsp:Transcript_36516/g.59061  ORF Transcript_36516/g.59061 Transcript_36516/m.59061 type:complete len:183 (-) Transcript_36516:515-1063(-)|eukprot:CAMPEP_0184650384 /NCGR_PEP_ID=MMETSP0308-20130426/7910_1 /TAXON_ID=38269 /ORGANISM="Gloeochaete witrockiana, Strain SAG 46.84" /LENGTH=182 /DNA_ID=CAMNT_0027083857 /DNA_START=149 /DNA_END=697 /DNA_ORIENTATION=-
MSSGQFNSSNEIEEIQLESRSKSAAVGGFSCSSSLMASTGMDVAKASWSWIKWGGEKAYHGAEVIGESIASFLGLYDSKYQDVLDEYIRLKNDEMEKKNSEVLDESVRLDNVNRGKDDTASRMEMGEEAKEDDGSSVAEPSSRRAVGGAFGLESVQLKPLHIMGSEQLHIIGNEQQSGPPAI